MITQIIKYCGYSSGCFWLLEPRLRCFTSSSFHLPCFWSVFGLGQVPSLQSPAEATCPLQALGLTPWHQAPKPLSTVQRWALYHIMNHTDMKFTKGIQVPHLSWGAKLHGKEQVVWRWHLNCPASESLQGR